MRTGRRASPQTARRHTRRGVRPTAARVRDAAFNSLAATIAGARVLDLFAGTGSLGVEALRRGARVAVFVEKDARMSDEIRRQLSQEGLAALAEVWKKDALTAIRELGRTGRQFDVIFMDPPYGEGWLARALSAIAAAEVLAPGGVVVAEGHWRDRPEEVVGLTRYRDAKYGETALWYFARAEGGTQP